MSYYGVKLLTVSLKILLFSSLKVTEISTSYHSHLKQTLETFWTQQHPLDQ